MKTLRLSIIWVVLMAQSACSTQPIPDRFLHATMFAKPIRLPKDILIGPANSVEDRVPDSVRPYKPDIVDFGFSIHPITYEPISFSLSSDMNNIAVKSKDRSRFPVIVEVALIKLPLKGLLLQPQVAFAQTRESFLIKYKNVRESSDGLALHAPRDAALGDESDIYLIGEREIFVSCKLQRLGDDKGNLGEEYQSCSAQFSYNPLNSTVNFTFNETQFDRVETIRNKIQNVLNSFIVMRGDN